MQVILEASHKWIGMLLNSARARQIMQGQHLDGLIATTPENVQYVSGLESVGFLINRYRTQVFALLSAERPAEPVVVAGIGDVSAVYQLCPPGTRSIHYGRFHRYVNPHAELSEHEQRVKRVVVDAAESNPAGAFDGLLAGLEEARLTRGRVGYDEKALDPTHLPRLRERFPELELVPAWDVFRTVRAVKTDEEIRRLATSLRLTEHGIQAAVSAAAVGCTEEDLIREFRAAVVRGGGLPLFNEVTFARRAAVGSLPVPNGRLREGDVIRFDIGCKFEGYCSDIARIFIYRGQPDDRLRRIYDAMKTGEDHALRTVRAGMTAGDLFEQTCRAVKDAGVPDYRRTHVGHAVGLEVYETPLLGAGERTVLEPGMVLEIETPYYEIGFTGVQVEDTVVVRDGGADVLTTLSRDIEVVG